MSNASLSFLPWVRQGAASAITTPDAPAILPTTTVSASLTLNAAPVSGVAVTLRGPGDVIGLDPNQIVRTDPRAGTHDFEPNCFPSIEFDRPDFPWLFTPATADAQKRLRPWLCLVVVRKQAGVTLSDSSPLPTLTIAQPALPSVELPSLANSWAWAHSQIAADNNTAAVDAAFIGGPELTVSRLVCPRMLAPETDYIACLVPTFDVGRKAGLGQPLVAKDLLALAPAWVPNATLVTLPVYYQWEFRTSQLGDFESLARQLTPGVPTGLGTRTINISAPGFPAGGATTAELEGALLPILPAPPAGSAPPPPPVNPVPLAFRNTLATIINEPSRLAASNPTTDPVLAPPLYGRWHAGTATAVGAGTTWFDQLNLDPRWRVAAAFGTRVVQEHQEALMASAWEQAADLPTANQRLRQLQLSMVVGEVVHKRHFTPLSEENILRIAAPAFGRLQGAPPAQVGSPPLSMLALQVGTMLPPAANRSAMRRIGRQRGPLSRRVAAQGFPRSATDTWVARMNNMWTQPGPPQSTPPVAPPPPPPLNYASLPALSVFTQRPHDTKSWFGAFFVVAPNAPLAPEPAPVADVAHTEVPDFFRSAARAHLDKVFPTRPAPVVTPPVVYLSVKQQVLAQTEPRIALKALAEAIIATGDGVLAPAAKGVTPLGVETVMAAPYFSQPMYETLRDISQELLLPGLDKVVPNTVCGLQTNRSFVESFMVGLNHEMGRELLWRGYPTDQRGTYFDRFWGMGVPNVAPPDITDLNTWSIPDATTKKIRKLGDSIGAPTSSEEFVMLMRSSLLRRYPTAVIYLTPAVRWSALPPDPNVPVIDPNAIVPDTRIANEKQPIFSGSMVPDVSFFGFPVKTVDAIGGPTAGLGYYLVIQEHPTEPRFGIDANVNVTTSHLIIGAAPPTLVAVAPNPPQPMNLQGGQWNTNAAEMARITRRLPVRVAIHASRLITPG
ncbi:MAG: hypothetical protein ABJE10_00995 [bacterium]